MTTKRNPLALVTGGLAVTAVGAAWLASSFLLRRRVPDPGDPPVNYGLGYEPVEFETRDGLKLRGWWILPPAGAPRKPDRALVLVHGQNGSMDGDTAQAAAFARAGYPVLMFNLRAHGSSQGQQVTFGAREFMDVLAALDWLQHQQGIVQVGVVGFSMGAGVALRAAFLDGRVRAVVADGTISRVADAFVGLGRQKGIPAPVMRAVAWAVLGMASLRAKTLISRADPIRWADRVPCPVLFIHGARDPFNTVAGAGRLAGMAPRGRLWLVPEAGHRDAYRLDPDTYYARVLGFLEEVL
ncbi:MAG: alpha/beta hydrolase [Anaerolineae bacterium]